MRQLSGSFQVQTPFRLKYLDLVGERSGEWWHILIQLLNKLFPFAGVNRILAQRMGRKEIGVLQKQKNKKRNRACLFPGHQEACTSLRDSPNKSQIFAWWEPSFHIPQTSPECLLCAQHQAKLWGSMGSCTLPVSSADLQLVRGLCSQKLVQGSSKGQTLLGENFWPMTALPFQGQSSGAGAEPEGLRATLPLIVCQKEANSTVRMALWGRGGAQGIEKGRRDGSRLLTPSRKFPRTPISFFFFLITKVGNKWAYISSALIKSI